MNVDFEITNQSFTAEEEFIQYQTSGYKSDSPEHVQEAVPDEVWDELRGGDWVVIADGEIVDTGEFCAFYIHAYE